MKSWIMTLPLLCAVSLATAQGVEDAAGSSGYPDAAVDQPVAAEKPAETAAPAKPRAQRSGSRTQTRKYSGRTLPKGDVRHCLDKKTQADLIRCSETGKRA